MKLYHVTIQLRPTGTTYTHTMLACSMAQAIRQSVNTRANGLMCDPELLRVLNVTTLNKAKHADR